MRLRWLIPLAGIALLILVLVVLARPVRAQRLPTLAVPEHYDLAFAVDIPAKRFEGTESIRIRVGQPTTRIVLNAAELTLHEATVAYGETVQTAGIALDQALETVTLTVSAPIPAGLAEIQIRYSGILGDKWRGFYLSQGEKRSYAVTQFESTDARRAFPSFDEPGYKATFGVTLTIDRGDMAISNGRILSDTPGPGPAQHTVTFTTSPKMSTYLVAMAVGDFECLEGGAGGIPIRLCTLPGRKESGRIGLGFAEDILAYYNSYYAIAYPFGKLDMVAIPDFAASAMENTAAIFFRDRSLLADAATASIETRKNIASTIAHEMAHQWFGDLVTMAWWDDLWLNEGFATWMETRPLAAAHPEWHMDLEETRVDQATVNLDSLQSTRPIHTAVRTPDEIESLFDAISYQKGAAVLRMIEQYVGPDRFRAGINAYLQAHAYGNATSEDFWKTMAAASGKPMERILPTFINQPGVPLVSVSTLTCSASGQTTATITQERFLRQPGVPSAGTGTAPPASRTESPWAVPACLKTSTAAAASTCLVVSQPEQTLDVAATCVPWIFLNAGGRGYYRTQYPPAMLRALAPHIADVLNAPERLALIDDEWALLRADRHSAAEYLTVAAGYGRESSSDVLEEVATRLRFVHQYLTTDASRPRFEAFVRDLLRPLSSQVGALPSPSDTDDQRALRAVVVGALGTTGNDGDVARRARTTVDRLLAGEDNSPLDLALRDTLVQIAARHGDEKLYDALAAAATRATSPDERRVYLDAAAAFTNPPLVDRALRRTLTADIRTQDAARYLAGFFDNPATAARAWSFLKTYWADLEPKLRGFNGGATVTRALGAFCDAGTRDDVTTFFAGKRLPGAAAGVNQAVERINSCISLRERQTRPVTAWLASR
jgi:aminopeptidase N